MMESFMLQLYRKQFCKHKETVFTDLPAKERWVLMIAIIYWPFIWDNPGEPAGIRPLTLYVTATVLKFLTSTSNLPWSSLPAS